MFSLQEEILHRLESIGAIVRNSHFEFTSGRHSATYINKDAIFPYTSTIQFLCQCIARYFLLNKINYEVVVGPEKGGIILAQWTASAATQYRPDKEKEVLAVYAEKEGKEFLLRRGYDKLMKGKEVLVVEDNLTTGASVKSVVEVAREAGATVVGVGALCNREGVTVCDVGNVPILYSVLDLQLVSWLPQDCPLCKAGIPINTQLGHGKG